MLDRDDTLVRGIGWSVIQWTLGILGGIATFLGFFVAFGPQEEYIGLGGDLSWQVAGVSDGWMYSMIVVGLVLLAAAVWMAVAGRGRARVTSTAMAELMLHAGVFVGVNAFVWAQDIALGDGLDYALWVTVPWAVGLAAHAYGVMTSKRAHEPTERELQHH